jgi:hypothetical protein
LNSRASQPEEPAAHNVVCNYTSRHGICFHFGIEEVIVTSISILPSRRRDDSPGIYSLVYPTSESTHCQSDSLILNPSSQAARALSGQTHQLSS